MLQTWGKKVCGHYSCLQKVKFTVNHFSFESCLNIHSNQFTHWKQPWWCDLWLLEGQSLIFQQLRTNFRYFDLEINIWLAYPPKIRHLEQLEACVKFLHHFEKCVTFCQSIYENQLTQLRGILFLLQNVTNVNEQLLVRWWIGAWNLPFITSSLLLWYSSTGKFDIQLVSG